MTKYEMFQLLLSHYDEIKNNKESWFHKEDDISCILKPYGAQYTGFIISGKIVYNFIFQTGGNEFIHTIVRKNNSYIKISGPQSMDSFTYIHNLSYMDLVTMCGNVRSNTDFWKKLFSNY